MRKTVVGMCLTAIAGLSLVAGTSVANAAAGPVPVTVPYTASSSDGGTCGNQWAVDLFNRIFTIPKADPAGNYAVVEKFNAGHFSTTAGQSPGACNNGTADNGNKIKEGVSGSFSGNLHLFIQNGAYDAGDGTCNGYPTSDPVHPCTTSSYVAYHYGVAATVTETSYSFVYNTSLQTALGKHWTEAGTGGPETDTGDINTA